MIHESLISGPLYMLFASSFLLFLVAPGWFAADLLFGRRDRELVFRLPLAFGLSLAMAAFWFLSAYLAGSGVRTAIAAHSACTLALVAVWLVRRWRARGRDGGDLGVTGSGGGSRVSRTVLWVLVAAGFVLVLSRGTMFSWRTDSLDHVGTIREIVETDRVFPTNSFYPGQSGLGADPRKGLYHTSLAMIAIVTGIEPFKIWIWLASLLFPLILLGYFSFARELFGDEKTALVSAVLFVLCIKGIDREFLRVAGFPAQVAYLIYLLALLGLFRYLRTRDIRYLAVVAVLGSTAGTVHIFYFFKFGLALLVFLLFVLLMKRSDRDLILNIVKSGVLTVVLALPYLIVKYRLSYSVENPFDEHLRHVMFITHRWYVVNPDEPWNLVGPMAVLALVLTPFLYRRAKRDNGILFLFAATVSTPLLMYNPLLVPLLGELLTTGLVRRIVLLSPYIAVLGFFTTRMMNTLSKPSRLRSKVGAAVFLLVMISMLIPYGGRLARTFGSEAMAGERNQSAFRWYGALRYLEDKVGTPAVVLSDPWTSYSIPAFTGDYVVAVPVGHSSPKDAENVIRIRDAMDVLNPYVDMAETRAILDNYDVDYVVLNETYTRPISEYGWSLDPSEFPAMRAKFESNPGVFVPEYRGEGVTIYRYDQTAAVTGVSQTKPPFVVDHVPELKRSVNAVFDDRFMLLGATAGVDTVKKGNTLAVVCYWKKLVGGPTTRHYQVIVRFDTDYDKNALYRPHWSKVYRYVLQKVRGTRYRFRWVHDPLNGLYPPYRWRTGEILEDAFEVRVPADVAPGPYEMKLLLYPVPFGPVQHVTDFLRDDDVYDGVPVATIEITN